MVRLLLIFFGWREFNAIINLGKRSLLMVPVSVMTP